MRKSNPDKKSIFTCKWCKKEFQEWTYRQPTFCSNQCRSEYAAIQPKIKSRKPESYITKNCTICGKPYTVHKIFVEKRISNYCSKDCRAEFFSKSRKGKNNPNYVHGNSQSDYGDNWLRQSRKAKNRDNHTCQICGYESGGNKYLDVHHIVPFVRFGIEKYKEANHLTNLITLCRSCHAKVEKETRVIWEMLP